MELGRRLCAISILKIPAPRSHLFLVDRTNRQPAGCRADRFHKNPAGGPGDPMTGVVSARLTWERWPGLPMESRTVLGGLA